MRDNLQDFALHQEKQITAGTKDLALVVVLSPENKFGWSWTGDRDRLLELLSKLREVVEAGNFTDDSLGVKVE